MSDYYMFSLRGTLGLVRVRVIRDRHLVTKKGLASCSWCHMFIAQPVAAIIENGITIDIVTCMCYCPHCEKGTIIVYELPTAPGERSHLKLPSSTG